MAKEELRKMNFFKNLSDEFLDLFLPLVSEERAAPGKMIFEEGSVSDRFFIIKEGEVEIRKVIDRENERYKLIAILSSGEFFGEMAVFMGQPRSAEALARTDATLLTVKKDVLFSLFNERPDAAFKIMEFVTSILMDRLRNTTRELASVYETGRLIAAARSLRELSEHTIQGLMGAVETAEAAVFAVWNVFNDEFEIVGHAGMDIEPGTFIPESDGLIRWLSEKKEPFLSFDLANERRLQLSGDGPLAGRSIVAAPLISKDRLQGVLVLLNRASANAFSYNHMVLLSAISGYVTVAFDNLKFIQDEADRSRLSKGKHSIPF